MREHTQRPPVKKEVQVLKRHAGMLRMMVKKKKKQERDSRRKLRVFLNPDMELLNPFSYEKEDTSLFPKLKNKNKTGD